jgi:hypothetical protein
VFAQHTFYTSQAALTIATTPPVFQQRDKYISIKYPGKIKLESSVL